MTAENETSDHLSNKLVPLLGVLAKKDVVDKFEYEALKLKSRESHYPLIDGLYPCLEEFRVSGHIQKHMTLRALFLKPDNPATQN